MTSGACVSACSVSRRAARVVAGGGGEEAELVARVGARRVGVEGPGERGARLRRAVGRGEHDAELRPRVGVVGRVAQHGAVLAEGALCSAGRHEQLRVVQPRAPQPRVEPRGGA